MKYLALALALIASPAAAQVRIPTPTITPQQLNSLQAQINAKANAIDLATKANIADLPQPANTLPAMENPTPSLGTSNRFLREDYVPMRITRGKKVLTDSAGNWTVTWAKPLPNSPITLPIPVNTAGSATITCNVTVSTTTTSSGYCTQTRGLPAAITLLGNLAGYLITQIAPTGTVVQVFAIPTTD